MNRFIYAICLTLFVNISLSAQNKDIILVKADTKVLDYFPFQERYRYPHFIDGKVMFKSGNTSKAKLNYDILLGEVVFIQSQDTLTISRKKDIRNIVIARDTFLYDNGYLELIHSGNIRVGLNYYVKIKEVLKKGAFGTTARGVSTDTYNSLESKGSLHELIPNEDLELQKTKEYYLSTPTSGFIHFRKKNVFQLFPEKNDAIKGYLKSNKVDFDSEKDLLKLADYLQNL